MKTRLVLVASTLLTGCGVRYVAPPEAPPATVPEIPEAPDASVSRSTDFTGRVLIDTGQERARVMRVTETLEGTLTGHSPAEANAHAGMAYGGILQKAEMLCITPCAVDLGTGVQTLLFTSTSEATKTSTADVAVARGTTVVRHALGSEKPWTWAYIGGGMLGVFGTFLTLTGAMMLGSGLEMEPKFDEAGKQTNDPQAHVTAGVVVGATGIAALVSGVVLMIATRPTKRPGATTTFRVSP